MMDRLRSPVRTFGVTALLICALSLAGLGVSHARPQNTRQSAQVNGLACNAVCKAYMAWSHRVTAMFRPSRKMLHASRPQKRIAAHQVRPPRRMAHHAPKTHQRSLNSFAQLPAQSDVTPEAAEAPPAAERPPAAETPRRAERPQATETPQATEAPQAAEAPRSAEAQQAAEPLRAAEAPQAKVAPSRPIDQIAGRFPAAAEFMATRRGGTDGTALDEESTVADLERTVAALDDTTPLSQAIGIDAFEDGLQLAASLLLMLGSLPTFVAWWWFRTRRDATRERHRPSTVDRAIAARPKPMLVEVVTGLGSEASLQTGRSAS